MKEPKKKLVVTVAARETANGGREVGLVCSNGHGLKIEWDPGFSRKSDKRILDDDICDINFIIRSDIKEIGNDIIEFLITKSDGYDMDFVYSGEPSEWMNFIKLLPEEWADNKTSPISFSTILSICGYTASLDDMPLDFSTQYIIRHLNSGDVYAQAVKLMIVYQRIHFNRNADSLGVQVLIPDFQGKG